MFVAAAIIAFFVISGWHPHVEHALDDLVEAERERQAVMEARDVQE